MPTAKTGASATAADTTYTPRPVEPLPHQLALFMSCDSTC